MKALLQQQGTGFYVGATAPLVLHKEEARLFANSVEAVDYCVAEGIADVEVILEFSDAKYNVVLRPFGHPETPVRSRQFASNAERLACLQDEIRERAAG